MNSHVIEDLNLEQYVKIVVNLFQLQKAEDNQMINKLEEQKITPQIEQYDKDEVSSTYDQLIYSIKEKTHN